MNVLELLQKGGLSPCRCGSDICLLSHGRVVSVVPVNIFISKEYYDDLVSKTLVSKRFITMLTRILAKEYGLSGGEISRIKEIPFFRWHTELKRPEITKDLGPMLDDIRSLYEYEPLSSAQFGSIQTKELHLASAI